MSGQTPQNLDEIHTGDPSATPEAVRRLRGAALRTARTAAGLSARELVDRVNARTAGSDLTDHALYAYERGRVLLSREVAERLASVLRLSPGELLAGDPDFASPHPPAHPTEQSAQPELSDTAPPADPQTLAWLLPARLELLAQTRPLLQTLGVLTRQLRRARPGLTRPAYLVGTFDLALDQLRELLDTPALGRAARSQRDWGIDQLQTFRQALLALHKTAELQRTALLDLDPLSTPPTAPASAQRKAFHAARKRLAQRARRVQEARLALRQLVADGR